MNDQNEAGPNEIPVQPSAGEGEASDHELYEESPHHIPASAAGADLVEQMQQAELEGRAALGQTEAVLASTPALQGRAEASAGGVPAGVGPASAVSGDGQPSKEEKEEQEDAGAPLAGERGEEPADDIDMEAANQAPQEPANNQAKAHI